MQRRGAAQRRARGEGKSCGRSARGSAAADGSALCTCRIVANAMTAAAADASLAFCDRSAAAAVGSRWRCGGCDDGGTAVGSGEKAKAKGKGETKAKQTSTRRKKKIREECSINKHAN